MPERESIWSVGRGAQRAYFLAFVAQVLFYIGLVTWKEFARGDGSGNLFDIGLAVWERSAPLMITSAAVALVAVETGGYLVVLARGLAERVEKIREERRAEGRTEVIKELAFIRRIKREVIPIPDDPSDRGFQLERPDKSRFGFVRFNIAGKNPGMYRVYAYWPFNDPHKLFENRYRDNRPQGWTCVVDPDDEDKVRHVIRVLESSHDQRT